MSDFATTQDVQDLWRPLTSEEQDKVSKLIPLVCDSLRFEARKVRKDLDELVDSDNVIKNIAKSVTVDVVKRYMLDNAEEGPAMSQMSQAALGYSVSGTYLVPGGGIFIKKSELARLGLTRQQIGVIDLTWE